VEVPGTNDFEAGFDKLFELRKAETDEFYASRISAATFRRREECDAAGVCRMLWSKQFYQLRRENVLEGDPAGPPTPKERATRKEQGLDASLQRRHHFDARQVGVSVVRGVGPGVPLYSASRSSTPISQRNNSFCCCANGICIRTDSFPHMSGHLAMSNPPYMPGLRGAFIKSNGVRGVADRGFPRKSLSQAAPEFHMVGESERSGRRQYFPRRLSGLDNIGVFDRSAPLPNRRTPRAVRRTSWMGMYLPEYAGDRA